MEIVSKTQLAKNVAKKLNLPPHNKLVAEVVTAIFEEMSAELEAGNEIRMMGFGSLSVVERKESTGFNPRTKEKIQIPAYKTVKFKVSKALKEKLNK